MSEPEGLSFEPAQWRDYMLDRLSNDGTSSSSSTSLAASEGNATPIMAASPPAPDQPLVSPDSLLDPLEDQPPPSATAACPECAHAQQMSVAAELDDADELELTVEIKEDDDDQSQEKVFVASMGPAAVGESSYGGDNNIDSSDAAVKINSSLLPSSAEQAHDHIESPAKAVEPLIEETSDGNNSAPAALAESGEGAVPDEEEANSECEYAREEEPAVGVDSHLMADVVFSQQKLHELLNQLGKESRYSSSPVRTTETDETAAAAAEDETKIDVAAVEKKEEELLSASKAASPTPPPEAAGGQRTPDRGDGGDHEISDHIDRPKLRKCSSLKSGRTPPGTPGVRKIVR